MLQACFKQKKYSLCICAPNSLLIKALKMFKTNKQTKIKQTNKQKNKKKTTNKQKTNKQNYSLCICAPPRSRWRRADCGFYRRRFRSGRSPIPGKLFRKISERDPS
jgi:hypothetical protein